MAEYTLERAKGRDRTWSAVLTTTILLVSLVVGAMVVALPNAAGGVTAATPSAFEPASGSACTLTIFHETAGNHAVQLAINTFGPLSSVLSPVVICLGPGTFPEQLTVNNTTDLSIVGAGNASTFLAPASVQVNGVDLDSGSPVVALVGAWNDTNLTVSDLTVDASSAGAQLYNQCTPGLLGVYYGNSSGTLVGDSIANVNNNGGCQDQNAVFVNTGFFLTNAVVPRSFTIANSTASNFGKNGITCNGVGLVCSIVRNTVTTSPMVLGYAATNGIQFDGATGSIVGNLVSGDLYLPGDCSGGTYFGVSPACAPYDYFASGILVLQASSVVNISGNTLTGDQVGIWSLANPVQVWDNQVSGGYFGVVFDFNPADAFGATYAFGADVGGGNSVSGANVGMFAYDANATFVGNTISTSNVSFEDENDIASSYAVSLTDNLGSATVSGALLGDVSSFQTGSSSVVPSGSFSLNGDRFTNISAAPGVPDSFGVYVSGASATVNDTSALGFSQGIAAVVQGWGNVTNSVVTAPASVAPGIGVYVFAGESNVSGNSVSGYEFMTGPGWWPDSQAAGIFVQSIGRTAVSTNSLSNDAIGIAVVSSVYGPFPAPSWPYANTPSAGPIDVSGNSVSDSGAFGIALELNQGPTGEVAAPLVTVSANTVDNTLSGAVGLMVDQGTYSITDNVFIGTSASGSSGATQATGDGTIDTASIQVLDAYDSVTRASVSGNQYEATTLDIALLNVTSDPPYYASVIGQPVSFVESGLAPGTTWQVTVGATPYATTSGSITVDFAPGTYGYAPGTVAGYAPIAPSTFTAGDSATPLTVPIAYDLLYGVTFSEEGLPSGLTWSVTFDGTPLSLVTDGGVDELTFASVPNGSYAYSIGGLSGWSQATLAYAGTLTIAGGAVSELLDYTQVVYSVSFEEQGLPSGLDWTVTFNGNPESVTTLAGATSETFPSVPNGTYSYSVAGTPGWHQASFAYTGTIVVTGADVLEVAHYVEVTYAVSFSESGLPASLTWSVTFDGSTLSLTTVGSTDTLSFAAEPNGSYAYSIATVSGWQQATIASAGTEVVNGAPVAPTLSYTQVVYSVKVYETGLPAGLTWSLTFDGVTNSLTTNGAKDLLTFASEPNGTYSYHVATVSGWREFTLPPSGSLPINGAPLTRTLVYHQVLYTVNVVEHHLPAATSWKVTIGATSVTTTTTKATFELPNGSYTYTLGVVPGWKPAHTSGTFSVVGTGVSVGVSFSKVTYAVVFDESGLPGGTSWSVSVDSQLLTGTGTSLTVHLPNGTYAFSASSTGYTPSGPTSVSVHGARVVVTIVFT